MLLLVRPQGPVTFTAGSRRGHPWLVPLIILTGLITTGLAFTLARSAQRQATERALHQQATAAATAARAEADRYCSLLEATAAGIALDNHLTWEDFDAATAPLAAASLPGAASVAYVVPTTTADIPATQRRWRTRGAEGLLLTAPAPAPEHYFTIFTRPLTDAAAATRSPVGSTARSGGIDPAIAPEVVQALLDARRLSSPAASDTYLPPAAPRQRSLVFAAPIWTRAAEPVFHGWVVLDVRGQDFLGGVGPGLDGELLATAQDGSRPAVARFGEPGGDLVRASDVAVADREWTLVTRRSLPGSPLVVLPGGAAVTVFLAALAHLSATRRRPDGRDCRTHRHPAGPVRRAGHPLVRPGRQRPPARRAPVPHAARVDRRRP
jgi:hypothetical protein